MSSVNVDSAIGQQRADTFDTFVNLRRPTRAVGRSMQSAARRPVLPIQQISPTSQSGESSQQILRRAFLVDVIGHTCRSRG